MVVTQLQDAAGRVAAGLEAQPLDGRYPTQNWATGEFVRDRHTLSLPADLPPGAYRLIVGLYRGSRPDAFGNEDRIAWEEAIIGW